MNANQTTDLELLAFGYLHEELSAEETAAFEQRLAEDQRVREALAHAVELSHACRAALATPVTSNQTGNWVSIAGWVVAGVAAAIAVFATVQSAYPPANSSVEDSATKINSELISAWSESSDWNEQETLASEESPIVPSELAEFEFINDTPGWMLSAVQSAGDNDMEREPSSDTQ